jgi:parallel beta-helix repeat protein
MASLSPPNAGLNFSAYTQANGAASTGMSVETFNTYIPPYLFAAALRALVAFVMNQFGPQPFVETPAARGTLYGSPTGNDANPGTLASPKTLRGAITAAAAGDVVFLRGGTYSITGNLIISNIGTLADPIIIESYPGELAIWDGSAEAEGSWAERWVTGNFLRIRNIEVRGFPRTGLTVEGSDNIFDGLHVHDNRSSGLYIYSGAGPGTDETKGSRNIIRNCVVHDNSDAGLFDDGYANGNNADGISINSGADNIIEHNLVYLNSDDGIDAWDAIRTYIGDNIIYSNGIAAGDGSGIKGGGAARSDGSLIERNLVYSNTAIGLDANSGTGQTWRNNTTWNNGVSRRFVVDTIAQDNISPEATVWGVTGVETGNSWNIGGTVTFISTDPGSPDFLKPVAAGAYVGIGAHAL